MDDGMTVREHLEACRKIEKLMDDSNAMVSRLQRELQIARATLEALRPGQHPMIEIPRPTQVMPDGASKIAAPILLEAQIKRINNILGDRA